jgi:hypothetical protein
VRSSDARYALESTDDFEKFVIREASSGKIVVCGKGKWPRWISPTEVAFLDNARIAKVDVAAPLTRVPGLTICEPEGSSCRAESAIFRWSDASLSQALVEQINLGMNLFQVSTQGTKPYVFDATNLGDRTRVAQAVSPAGAVCALFGERKVREGIGLGMIGVPPTRSQSERMRADREEEAADRVKPGAAALWCASKSGGDLQHIRELNHKGIFQGYSYDDLQFFSETQVLASLPSGDKCIITVATAETQCTPSRAYWEAVGDGRWILEGAKSAGGRTSLVDVLSRRRFKLSQTVNFAVRSESDPTQLIGEGDTSNRSLHRSITLPPVVVPSIPLSALRPEDAQAPIPAGSATGRKGSGRIFVRQGSTTVNGRLPPEVIQRIVRQNFGAFRACHDRAGDTALTGTVTTRFVIARDGSVSSAEKFDSDLSNDRVTACVVSAFKNLSYPAPDGGVVIVTFPVHFTSE